MFTGVFSTRRVDVVHIGRVGLRGCEWSLIIVAMVLLHSVVEWSKVTDTAVRVSVGVLKWLEAGAQSDGGALLTHSTGLTPLLTLRASSLFTLL